VPPGKEGKISLAIEHTDGYVGEVAKGASVTTNDPKYPNFSLTIRAHFKAPANAAGAATVYVPAGKAVGPFNISPSERWVTSALSGSSAASHLYLYNREATPIHIKKIDAGGTAFTASVQTIEDGKRYDLAVATNPSLKPGTHSQIVRVSTDSATSPEVAISLEVTIFPQIFATPNSIILPKFPISADPSTLNLPPIYVRKVRDTGLMIKRVTSTLPFLKLDVTTEKEGQFYTIRVTIDKDKIPGPGEFKGAIKIETNNAETPFLEVPIQGAFIP
jgi:hypothetical protein